MVPQAEHEHVPVKRWPVLLANDKHTVLRRQRMRAPAGNEVLVVENPVVLVGDLLQHDVLVSASDIIIRFSRVLCRFPA